MMRWAATNVSRFLVGKDGRTAYERRRGRRCNVPTLPFGEKVWYKQIRESKERKDKMDSEERLGVWMGHHRQSNEHVIGTTDGVVRAYSIRRTVEGRRWGATLIKSIQGTPQRPNPNMPGEHIPIRVRFDPGSDDERPPPTR